LFNFQESILVTRLINFLLFRNRLLFLSVLNVLLEEMQLLT